MKNERNYRSRSPEYRAWEAMRDRCTNPKNIGFQHYGGRGIKVCARWSVFENFLADMGRKPSLAHSLDRKDNDGDYAPDNCRWATKAEQMNNRTTTRWLEHDGVRLSLAQWARRIGISEDALDSRLRAGWPLARALRPEAHRQVTFNGRAQTIAAWAAEVGLSASALTQRLNRGWPVERALQASKRNAKGLPFRTRQVEL